MKMTRYWNTATTNQAQALLGECLRGGARVPVVAGMESVSAQVMNKDFIDHDPGGSDG